MTREEKLKKIKEVIADKSLGFGCIVTIDGEFCKYIGTRGVYNSSKDCRQYLDDYKRDYADTGMIGHPVMIGDVLDWMPKGPNFFDDTIPVIDLRTELRKPIDEQVDQCIDYIYSLIPTQ